MDNIHIEAKSLKAELKLLIEAFTFVAVLKYTVGMFLIAIGVSFYVRSTVGLSSWDTLHYSLDNLLPITFGQANMIVSTTITLLTITLQKNLKYLVMLLPIFIVAMLIDLFNDIVFAEMVLGTPVLNILGYVIALSILPLGGSFMIISGLPAGVFDEFMIAVMKVFKTNKIVLVRAIIELTIVALAILFGFIGGIGFGLVSIGTLIFSVLVGWYIKQYLKMFERIGLYKRHKPTD